MSENHEMGVSLCSSLVQIVFLGLSEISKAAHVFSKEHFTFISYLCLFPVAIFLIWCFILPSLKTLKSEKDTEQEAFSKKKKMLFQHYFFILC